MHRYLLIAFLAASTLPAQLNPFSTGAQRSALVQKYCAGCHSEKGHAGGLIITKLDFAHPENDPDNFEKVIRKLRAGMMPPSGMPRPDNPAIDAFASSLEASIDAFYGRHPSPGTPALHRLNRTEYQNSVRDLLNLNIDATSLLPPDDASDGFDNQAGALNVSPTLMEAYIRAAGKISRLAVGDREARPVVETYHVPANFSQTGHVDGTPLGTRGGLVIRHNFPADGEYSFKITLYFTTNTFVFGTHQKDEDLEIAVNGERVALLKFNPRMKVDDDLRTPPIKIKAGPQVITASFLTKSEGAVDDFVQPIGRSLGDLFAGQIQGLTALPHVRDVGITGPFKITGITGTPSRAKIFGCNPAERTQDEACARRIIRNLASAAYRRPVTKEDTQPLLDLYSSAYRDGGFEAGIRLAVQAILASPQFVFRLERTPANLASGSIFRVSDIELASRLSYFLWSSAPDAELVRIASAGQLHKPTILRRQVQRMLTDPKSEALAKDFAGQWLYLRNLRDAQPDVFTYPNSNDNLLASMQRETELFFDSIVHEDRSVLTLLDADYTFVNEDLAKLYGIPNIAGSRFRRVNITDANRRGLLGQASILTVTSVANRTSPVIRGKWILENLLGTPPPPPPPNVPSLKEASASGKILSVRQRLEEHRSNQTCAACHRMMDPIGFSLENFDGIGAWRIHDGTADIDTKGQLVDGTPVDSPASLRRALLDHSDAFLRTFTQTLLTYALGRGVQPGDMAVVRAIDHRASANGNRFSSFILGIVNSAPFQMRQVQTPKPVPSQIAAVKAEGETD